MMSETKKQKVVEEREPLIGESGGKREEWLEDEIDEGEEERVELIVRCSLNGVTIAPHLIGDGMLLRSCAEHPWQPIHLAAMMGDLNAVRGLTKAVGPSVCTLKAGCSMRTPMIAAAKAGQLTTAKWLYRVGKGPGCKLLPGKLLGLAVRSQKVEMVEWVCQEEMEDFGCLSSDGLYKLFSAAMIKETREELVTILGAYGGAKVKSIGLVCSAARQVEGALKALVKQGARVLQEEYKHMLDVLPPGTFIEMMKGLMSVGGLELVEEEPMTLLLHAVVVGSPDLCGLLIEKGATGNRSRSSSSLIHARRNVTLPAFTPMDVGEDDQELLEEDEEGDDDKPWSHPLWACCLGFPSDHVFAERLKLGTDHSVMLCEMLLKQGKCSPFLMDARGNLLLDALWCGYWWMSEKRNGLLRPRFELEDNRLRLFGVVRDSMCSWSPARHYLWPQSYRDNVRELLLCNQRLRHSGKCYLSKDLLLLTLQWLAVAETDNGQTLRRALLSFNIGHIKTVLSERGHALPHAQVTRKARKTELVDLALKMKQADEEQTRQSFATSASLPPIIGRLTGREERSGTTFSLDIVNPTVQPWVNIGRSFIKHPKGGATLDMDLSRVEYSRRISRLHATIRYNILSKEWEVQIRGRNGLEIDRGTTTGPELCVPGHAWIPLPPSLSFRMPFANLSFQLEDLIPRPPPTTVPNVFHSEEK